MYVFSWLDNRTLIACDFMLAVAFAAVFFGMKRSYPNLRGINTIAISFLLGVPGTFLLAQRGSVPNFVSITMAHCFVFGSFIFLYRGILRFIGSRRTAFIPIAVSCVALAVLFYYSQIQDRVVPRIVVSSLTVGLIRGLIALELFRKSPTFTSPKAMRLFAACMTFFAAVTVNCGLMAVSTVRPCVCFRAMPSAARPSSLASYLPSSPASSSCSSPAANSSPAARTSRKRMRSPAPSTAAASRSSSPPNSSTSSAASTSSPSPSSTSTTSNPSMTFRATQPAMQPSAMSPKPSPPTCADAIYLGRYGGDEFLLILPQTPCSIALVVTERLCQAVSNLSLFGRNLPLTLSIGLTEAVVEDNAVTLIARADKALYQAKSAGRNCRRVITANPDAHRGRRPSRACSPRQPDDPASPLFPPPVKSRPPCTPP